MDYSREDNRWRVLLNSESSVKYNIKRLHNDIQEMEKGIQRIRLQIGPRDAAKLIRGMGACGLETRCCAKFLTEFSSISIRMAKTQDISLTPSEITGMCGRLRCCLMYEYDQYVEAIKTLPKRKRKVTTPLGEGRVVQILPMRQAVIVDLPEIGPRQFSKGDLDRAEKIARGEDVEAIQDKDSKPDVMVSRPEDQTSSREINKKQTRKGRGNRSSRRGHNSHRSKS